MNKIALITPANSCMCPFVDIYTDVLKEEKLQFDIISWDRTGDSNPSPLTFKRNTGSNKISKLIGHYKFSKHVIEILNNNHYEGVIVFTSQLAISLYSYLKYHYNNKYIFDFRDISVEQIILLKGRMKGIVNNSYANVVSSPGFIPYLPKNTKYYLSHNFSIEKVRIGLQKRTESPLNINNINILTIGGIRDYKSNSAIINALGNEEGFVLRFVGKGNAAESLQKFADKNNYKNIIFQGFYNKKDEPEIIRPSSFINIYYPHTRIHSTALSNRFYNSLIYRKPMIVTKGQIQGDFCEKYNLGLAISNTDNLPNKLKEWIDTTDYSLYENRCISLLKTFQKDYDEWKNMFLCFLHL